MDDRAKAGYNEPWNDLYGYIIGNLTYAENNKIVNTFKIGSENYDEKNIGNWNDGEDYQANQYNKYTLYISTKALQKNKPNIILFIHGKGQTKENMQHLSSRYAKMGFITAILDFTDPTANHPENVKASIYRALDEVTMCLNHIKNYLINKYEFEEKKMELAIGGFSLGGILTLSYGNFLRDKSPIPIKFLISIAGGVSSEPEYWYRINDNGEPYDTIDYETVKKGIEDKYLVPVFKPIAQLQNMNGHAGNKFTSEQISKMIINNNIDKTNADYKEMVKIISPSFAINHIDKNTVPIIAIQGGLDTGAGLAHVANLMKKMEEQNIFDRLKFVYMKYGDHPLMDYKTENGKQAMRDLHSSILDYTEKYFSKE